MKLKSFITIILLIPLFFFSQKKQIDTIYIEFNQFKDMHYEKKNANNYFDICIDNKKHVHFQYGTTNIKTIKKFNKNIVNRHNLSKIIKNDNANKPIVYIIIKKLKNNGYNIYEADHIFRTIID